jgi:hypothetical protein
MLVVLVLQLPSTADNTMNIHDLIDLIDLIDVI